MLERNCRGMPYHIDMAIAGSQCRRIAPDMIFQVNFYPGLVVLRSFVPAFALILFRMS